MSAPTRRHPGLNLGDTDASAHSAAEEVIFGFWIFLMTDLVLFALLFATYATMSEHGVAAGPAPHAIFRLSSALIETMLLLASSFTFGLASLALKYRKDRVWLAVWLGVTFLLGLGFVLHETHELYTLATSDDAAPQRSGFLSAFYLLVSTHGLHVTAGLVWILHSLIQVASLGLIQDVKLRIMRLALFWHMLDVVWIGIFTFVFLFGVASG